MSRTAHKTNVWQYHLHGARVEVEAQNQYKTFMIEIQWNVQNYTKLMFSICSLPQGV